MAIDSVQPDFWFIPPSCELVRIHLEFFRNFLILVLQAGRVSDIYHPKPVFIAGFLLIGILGIGAGFVKTLIGLIVIRAFQGIGAAMTIPSATLMLTAAYTSPLAQGVALTL